MTRKKFLIKKFSKKEMFVKMYRNSLSRAVSQFFMSIVLHHLEIGYFRQFDPYGGCI